MGDVLRFPRPDRPADRPVGPDPWAEPLWRQAVGSVLRARRQQRDETLADVAARSGVSVQYLSEVERGRKEPSSEVLAAVAGAVELTLLDLTVAVARHLQVVQVAARPVRPGRPSGPVALAA